MTTVNDELRMLKDSAQGWVARESPVTAFRRMRDSGCEAGFNAAAWRGMIEMGWPGVIVPEAYGGSGLGHRAMGVILEEMGRSLAASPLIASSVAAASALIAGGTEEQKRAWLPRIATGAVIGTLATEELAHHSPSQVTLRARADGDGFVLTGSKQFVLEAPSANVFIVSARTANAPGDAEGITLFIVEAERPGVTRRSVKLLDSRGAAHVEFAGCRVKVRDGLLGTLGSGITLLDHALDCARAALCAEMLGAANQAFAMTINYLKTRVQFGQLIGSFQALQHRAALMFCELELSRSAVEAALAAIDADSPDIAELVSLAKARMGDTLHLVTNETIQMHGGIGMTDAHDAGFYLKRARAAETAYGNQAMHRDRYARIKGF